MNFVSIDIETADSGRGGICAIGACLVMDQKIADSFYMLINPETDFLPMAQKVHGITQEDVADAPNLPVAFLLFHNWFFSYPWVIHNASFDFCALRRAADRYSISLPDVPIYCTMKTAKRYLKLDHFNLPSVADALGIPMGNHHNAKDDARAAALIACTMINRGYSLCQYVPPESLSDCIPCHRSHRPSQGGADYPDCEYWDGDIDFSGAAFVLTGKLPGMNKAEAEASILSHGGIIPGAFPGKKNRCYLIIGKESSAVTHGEGGKSNKILSAEKRIAKGEDVKLIRGDHFLDILNKKSGS